MTEENEKPSFLKLRISKKVRSDAIVDVKTILQDCDHESDERFFYVYFTEPSKNAKKLIDITGSWKTTKVWIGGKEVEDPISYELRKTILCNYFDGCDGVCKHHLYLGFGDYVYPDDSLSKTKVPEEGSLAGLNIWFENNKESVENTFENERLIYRLMKVSAIELDEDNVIFNKDILKEFLFQKLNDELKYCPIISTKKMEEIIYGFPDELNFTDVLMKSLTSRDNNGYMLRSETDLPERREIGEQSDLDEYEYDKKQAELIGDEVEKRLRKVLAEFFEKKG